MISKYNGRCNYCGQPTKANVDEYDIERKESFHIACRERDESEPGPEQFILAGRLSYIQYRKEMGIDGFLRSVSESSGGLAAWGLGSATHRGQVFSLRSGDQSENISEGRGRQSH